MFDLDDIQLPSLKGYSFEARAEDLLILKDEEYLYDLTIPQLSCSACHRTICYDFNHIDPILSSFYCHYCDIDVAKEIDLHENISRIDTKKFFWYVPKEENLFVIKEVAVGALRYTQCVKMDQSEEKQYCLKMLNNYRKKFNIK
ncbi:MAG: hypothetical protein EBZ49_11585 [Proteobacteria bacterium]|nr:hypothetical protein [Pseudomonadota bacterium]